MLTDVITTTDVNNNSEYHIVLQQQQQQSLYSQTSWGGLEHHIVFYMRILFIHLILKENL
jgi:hypothetical protein